MSRVDRITPRSKQTEYYSDFLMDFNRNPISGELARVSNERAVIRSMKNLINTNRGERFFNPNIGCGIRRFLFEPMDDTTADMISSAIITTIEEHEKRVQLKQVSVDPQLQTDAYHVTITFSMQNSPSEVFSFSTVLKRVR